MKRIDEQLLTDILEGRVKRRSKKNEKMGNDLPDGPPQSKQPDDEEEDELDAEDTLEAAAAFTKDSPMAKGSPMSADGEDGEEDGEDDEKEVEEDSEGCTPARRKLAKRINSVGRKV